MPFVNEAKPGLHRTIDYERNAIMSAEKSSQDQIMDFKILWNDAQIGFSAKRSAEFTPSGDVASVDWVLYSFKLPEFLQPKRSEVIDIIEEALKVYGFFGFPGLDRPCSLFACLPSEKIMA